MAGNGRGSIGSSAGSGAAIGCPDNALETPQSWTHSRGRARVGNAPGLFPFARQTRGERAARGDLTQARGTNARRASDDEVT